MRTRRRMCAREVPAGARAAGGTRERGGGVHVHVLAARRDLQSTPAQNRLHRRRPHPGDVVAGPVAPAWHTTPSGPPLVVHLRGQPPTLALVATFPRTARGGLHGMAPVPSRPTAHSRKARVRLHQSCRRCSILRARRYHATVIQMTAVARPRCRCHPSCDDRCLPRLDSRLSGTECRAICETRGEPRICPLKRP